MLTGPAGSTSVIEHCRRIARFSDAAQGTTRTFLSPAMRECLGYFQAWAERIGMVNVRVDAAGNFRALLPGSGARKLVLGSHLDSVPDAGAFDGVLGVVMGMVIAESCGRKPECDLEIVGFSEEEGVRFHRPFIGSMAFVGGLNDEVLTLVDDAGISVAHAIQGFGLDLEQASKQQMDRADAYLEFHIEQGPVLESLGLSLGVVDSIAGQTRATLEFVGQTNHAGTTPMTLRRDALCAAAEWTLLVERTALQTPGLVATVGSFKVAPDAVNIVPGRAVLSLDVRHCQDEVRKTAFENVIREGGEIATRRNVQFQWTLRADQMAVPMDAKVTSLIEEAVVSIGAKVHRMTSGAGHDAMITAKHIPSGMIFVRSPGGISHHPDESVINEDVDLALRAGRAFVHNFK